MSNIVLIGMPGSGKSSIGKVLAQMLSKQFFDIDDMIVALKKMTISEIFQKEGERAFREYENLCCKKIFQKKNLIISTGGGTVLFEENMKFLAHDGTIFFIERSIDQIYKSANLHDRPLIQNDRQKLQNLYNERIELYKNYADYIVENTKSIEETALNIIKIFTKNQ